MSYDYTPGGTNEFYKFFEEGREDGSQTNPVFSPGELQGEPLAAYTEGFKFGGECMDGYQDEMDDFA